MENDGVLEQALVANIQSLVKKSEKKGRVENGGLFFHRLPLRWSIGTNQWNSVAFLPLNAIKSMLAFSAIVCQC